MEKIEVIEEKKMIKRLLGKFFGYICLYGLLYIACMVIFLMFAIFQDESLMSIIMMCLINVAINLGFMVMLSNSSINNAFDGINTVNVPEKSRTRMLKIAGSILIIIMIIITATNIIIFHALFKSKIQIEKYTITTNESVEELKMKTIKPGTVTKIEKISGDKYLITSKTYSKDAFIIIGSIILLNILIVIGSINYENNLLKKYLVSSKSD